MMLKNNVNRQKRSWHHHYYPCRIQKRLVICCLLTGAFSMFVLFAFLRSSSNPPDQSLMFAATTAEDRNQTKSTVEIKERTRYFLTSFVDVVGFFQKELHLPDNETVFSSYAPPVDFALWPRLSNGAISTLPYHTSVFAAGVYNGARIAQLPAFLNQRVLDALVDGTTLSVAMSSEFSFHVLSGIFVTKITSPLFEISQLIYCHKKIPNLFVMDLSIKRRSSLAPRVAPSLTLRLQKTQIDSPDLQKIDVSVPGGQSAYGRSREINSPWKHWYGQTKLPEWEDNANFNGKSAENHARAEGTYVSVHYDETPQVLELKRGRVKDRWIFLSSYASSERESLKAYQLGKEQIVEDRLLDSHSSAWLQTWKNGRLIVNGNSTLSSAALSAQYALFSEIPTNLNEFDQKFAGLPMCGLAPMNMSLCSYGLISNDQEYAVVPAIFALQPPLAEQLVFSRLSHLPTAVANAARIHAKTGAAFPWLTATSGFELHSNINLARYNKASSGLVSAAMRMVLQHIPQSDTLIRQAFLDTTVAIAEFYAGHVRGEIDKTSLGIPYVIGPYDQSFVVNNSLPVNLLAKFSLRFASEMLPTHSDAPSWAEIAEKLPIPVAASWWNVFKIHDGFSYSTDVRLSDFVFLRPEFAGNNLPNKTLFKTLETYLPLYGEQSAFGLALFASNFLVTGSYDDATLMIERILRQYTSTYYKSLAAESSYTTLAKPKNASTTTTTAAIPVKKNSAYWVWLCGPNYVTMGATNCLASAAALPYALIWGWLGFSPSFTSTFETSSDRIFVASFRPVSPLPEGVSKIQLLDWQLPNFGDATTLSVVWNGTTVEFTLKNRIKNGNSIETNNNKGRCRFVCQIGTKFFKFSKKGSLTVKPSPKKKKVSIKLTCVKSF